MKRIRILIIMLLAVCPMLLSAQDEIDIPDVIHEPPLSVSENILTNNHDDAYESMQLLTQVMLLVKKNYYQDKSFEEITHAALHGLLSSLDNHSDFMGPDAYENLKDDTSGKFGGIGIHIGIRDGMLTVISPIEDTPAYRAGVQAGDRIIKINGTNSVGFTLRQAVNLLRGPVGEKVTVTFRRMDEDKPVTVDIIRDNIKVPTVKGAHIIRDGIGYIRVIRFAEPTAASLKSAITNLQAQGMSALVLDLRNNPGGLLRSAIQVADIFLKRGDTIVSTKGRHSVGKGMVFKARTEPLTDVPMAILINGGSASASEIVSGALHDNKRAVLVGDTSYGKGSVQSVIKVGKDGKSAIRLTTALYYTPSGRTIHKKGIEPDIPVYVRPREWRLIQMKRAHEENPDLFTDEEKQNKVYDDVIDFALVRAMDVLQAMEVFNKK